MSLVFLAFLPLLLTDTLLLVFKVLAKPVLSAIGFSDISLQKLRAPIKSYNVDNWQDLPSKFNEAGMQKTSPIFSYSSHCSTIFYGCKSVIKRFDNQYLLSSVSLLVGLREDYGFSKQLPWRGNAIIFTFL